MYLLTLNNLQDILFNDSYFLKSPNTKLYLNYSNNKPKINFLAFERFIKNMKVAQLIETASSFRNFIFSFYCK